MAEQKAAPQDAEEIDIEEIERSLEPTEGVPAPKTVTKALKTASRLGIAALVFAVIGFLVFVYMTAQTACMASDLLNNPSLLDEYSTSEIRSLIGTMIAGTDATELEGLAAFYAMVAMFIGFGAILDVITIMASIGLIRVGKRPEKAYRAFVLSIIGAIVALITFQIVSFILLLIAAIVVHREYSATVPEEDRYNGKQMGFMRFIEIMSVIYLIAVALILVFVFRSGDYDLSYWSTFVQMLLCAATLWILWNRKEHGREIIIAFSFVCIILDVVISIIVGRSALGTIYKLVWPLVLFFYFMFSKRAKRTLVQPWRRSDEERERIEDDMLWRPKSLAFWRNLLLFFCIFSVVGHWMEWGVCWLIRWGIVPGEYDPNSGIWRDMLNPFFLYGAAVVFIGLLLFPIKNWLHKKTGNVIVALILSFVVNTIFCGAIELIVGLIQNTPPDPVTGKLPLWDYQNMAFNFMGQICLLNTSFFGFMATLITWVVYPNMERWFRRMPKDIMNILTVVIVVFFVLVVCMYVLNL